LLTGRGAWDGFFLLPKVGFAFWHLGGAENCNLG